MTTTPWPMVRKAVVFPVRRKGADAPPEGEARLTMASGNPGEAVCTWVERNVQSGHWPAISSYWSIEVMVDGQWQEFEVYPEYSVSCRAHRVVR
jgi:hypothetical protein